MAAITQFLVTHNGRILHADDHVDSGRAIFLSRLEWDLACFDIPVSDFERYFNPLAEQYKIKYHLALTDHRPKVVILVSGYDHCLADLLYRYGTVNWGATSSPLSATTIRPSRWPTSMGFLFICCPLRRTSGGVSRR